MKSKGNVGFSDRNLNLKQIWQTVSAKFKNMMIGEIEEGSDREHDALMLSTETLINTLSFSHFIELLRLPRLDSDLKRRFYEIEAVKNAEKVRKLERAIDTLLLKEQDFRRIKRA